ncbi:MAG: DUF1559 domain-containing protein [Pirellulaceae bacterium]|nr:DUF1559 domain-containing protein [Pirellulaceae bacterium]
MSSDRQSDSQLPPQPLNPIAAGRSSGNNVVLIVSLVAVGALVLCGCGLGLLIPAYVEANRRLSCANNLKQIGIALHNYVSIHGEFPPAYSVDENGRPLHSWRTLILPYMEQNSVYTQIDLSKPWDDPVNQRFHSLQISAYSCPTTQIGQRGLTCYQVVVHPQALLIGGESRSLNEVTDGISNTLAVIESSEVDAVPWMAPQDLPLQNYLNSAGRSHHSGGRQLLLGDGAVRFVANSVDENTLNALVTCNGDEPVDPHTLR